MKILTTMGLRVLELEQLVVRAGNFFAGHESGATGVKSDVMDEAGRILGKKKEAGFDLVWNRLAKRGDCDSHGGMEYKRLLYEWQQYEGRDSLESFIQRRARIVTTKKEGGAV